MNEGRLQQMLRHSDETVFGAQLQRESLVNNLIKWDLQINVESKLWVATALANVTNLDFVKSTAAPARLLYERDLYAV